MADLLVGYDMVVVITQNEVNSQFQRLFGKAIQPDLTANGLSKGGGVFGKGQLQLSSYIRGYIDAPQVELATQANPTQVLFYFDFKTTPVTSSELGVTDEALAAAFTSSPDGTNALLIKTEDIPYHDENGNQQTLSGQTVNYWLTCTSTTLGTTKVYQYSLVPALYYLSNGNKTMIMLDGLRLSFQVLLNQMPTTVQAITDAVDAGTIQQEMLDTIQSNEFDSEAFSINQMFIDFDTTDFTQWNLKDPAGTLGGNVTGLTINSDGSYAVGTEPLSQLLSNDPNFSTELSTNLQYVFGVQGENTAGSNPYIVGVNITSSNPDNSNPTQPPSLVPTYIGYSTTPSSSAQGLSTINYQVLGGDNSESRVPKNNDGTVENVSTNFVQGNDFSGEILFSRSAFFDPFILNTIQNQLNTGASWSQDDNSTSWSSQYQNSQNLYHHDGTHLDSGPIEDVTQDDNNTYSIQVSDSKIVVSGTFQRTTTIRIEWKGVPCFGAVFRWWKDASLSWSIEIDMYIDTNGQLAFQTTPNIPQQATVSATQQDEGAKIAGVVMKVLGGLSGLYFDPIGQAMSQLGQDLSQQLSSYANTLNPNLAQGMKNNFISPTGKVFLLNGPRFNDELDLQMDITYDV